tara:strand:- start:10493 stop:11119 length:627 start_codon:yes stop_codon:yes gene_type:complete
MVFKDQIDEVLKVFNGLIYCEISNELSGILDIGDNDSYSLLITLDPFPKDFPRVWEAAERIPRKVTRHVYSDTGSLCFTTAAKAQILLQTKISTLLQFVNKILIPYLQNNSFYELNGHYATEEYAHDESGVLEGYMDILGIQNSRRVLEVVKTGALGKKLFPKNPCYCGSGQKLLSCNSKKHFISYKGFRFIDRKTLRADYHLIKQLI